MGKASQLPTDEELCIAAKTLDTFLQVSVFEQYNLLERHDIHPQLLHLYLEDLQKRFDKT